jgi:hypothetical protein
VLRLTKGRLHLSGGDIGASFTLDASATPAKFQGQTDIKGLNLRPLLTAFAGTEKLAGTLAATAELAATGANQAQMVSSLSGAGSVSLPPRSLDYTLQARLAPGHGIASALSGVAIPVRISGKWSGPKVDADWSAALGQINLKSVPSTIDKVAPDVNRLLPGLFRR